MMAVLRLYRLLTFLSAPFLRLSLTHRAAKGHEERPRLRERFGHASLKRPDGPLVWVHAASVGETNSVLPLIQDILTSRPAQHVLLTTGTVTSATIVARFQSAHADLRGRLSHQYVPLDRTAWVTRFLEHWRPDAGLWVESEIWPNMITASAARKIPLVMLNGRLSQRSFQRWQKISAAAQHLLGHFSLLTAQDNITAARLAALGFADAACPGNLKLDAPPLSVDEAALAALNAETNKRPHWLAASTHPGEEEVLAEAHHILQKTHADMLTIIVPRHPDRGDKIAQDLRRAGFNLAQRSRGDAITAKTQIYLMDTLGEMGLAYRLADLVFIGGTLVPHGGQNPFEAAQLDCAILHGPHTVNFENLFEELTEQKAVAEIADSATLAAQVKALLGNQATQRQMADAAYAYSQTMGGARARMVELLTPYLASTDTAPNPPKPMEAHDG